MLGQHIHKLASHIVRAFGVDDFLSGIVSNYNGASAFGHAVDV